MSLRFRHWSKLLLFGALATWTAATSGAEKTAISKQYGGYLVSTDFTVDGKDHTVISLPVGARPGDLLSIRPLRLNNDEYLILQRCKLPDCTDTQVVRAWNAAGNMGPYPVTSNKIPIARDSTYMLWMQRISTKGGNSFSLYERNSPALVFIPAGSAEIFEASDLAGARKRGPTRIDRCSQESSVFTAKFDGGSVVRMKLLRRAGKEAAKFASSTPGFT
ncbi:MAG TPA: hypothetical protein VK743_15110 [Steroidobacteraceae bacterium]|jgi:hypothetical protein|nr:hypothetical protein [Steroidobacteraceae bacterium]